MKIIYSFLYEILVSYYKTNKFDNSLFDQLYYGLEYYYYNTNIPVLIIAPLIHFTNEEEEIILDKYLKIRKIWDREREDFFRSLREDSLSLSDVALFNYVIELKTSEIKYVYNKENQAKIMKENNEYKKNYDQNITIIEKVIYSLRLLNKGGIGSSYIKYTDFIRIPGSITMNLSKGPHRSFGEQYTLKKEDIEKVLKPF